MLWQSFINGVAAGGAYALVALGFGLIFQACRFFHFAHGGVYAVAAYLTYFFMHLHGWSWWTAFPSATLGAALFGAGLDASVYRQLRRRSASSLVLLIASLGLLVAIQNCLSLAFGDATLTLRSGTVLEGVALAGARITEIQILTVGTGVLLPFCLWLCLQHSTWGKMTRAVSSDSELSSVIGIDRDLIICQTFAVGSGLAAVAAILIGYDTDLTPSMGFRALLMGVVAVIVGGVGSMPGAVVGGLLVGMAQHLGVWILPTQWQDAIVFVVLITFLCIRPHGFLGTPLTKLRV